MHLEIMDTTLRDGEQTSGVSFVAQEKLGIAKLLLDELHVDRIEIASARVSTGELEAAKTVCEWAAKNNHLEKIEVLSFVDNGLSIDWILEAGGRTMNLLAKGSLKHCEGQLRKSPEEHWADVKRNIAMACEKGLKVNLYLEDWSSGMLNSPDYVYSMIDALCGEPIERFMLPDTLGILNPYQTFEFCYKMVRRYPQLHFDFHAHNDYDLAVANAFAAAKTGVQGIHCTVNGLGERAGNTPLSSIVAVLHDQLKAETNIDESKINYVSHVVESFSGVRVPGNRPIIGELVFTQCAGIHADGDNKNNLYYNDLLPERFGRTREYALGKTSGKANISKNLAALNIELDEESMRKVTERIIELGDKKERVTQSDLPYIVADVLSSDQAKQNIQLLHYAVTLSKGLHPVAVVKLDIHGQQYETSSMGDGQYNAFVKAVRKIYKEELGVKFPMLTNYTVDIPPGGRTDAFVQTIITWEHEGESFKTRGLDPDQTVAAIKATIKMLNQIDENN
ncbi:MAG: alpha-isopropylmalate synthase regulatory domain-containing protein [Rikenellaceae bacterium]